MSIPRILIACLLLGVAGTARAQTASDPQPKITIPGMQIDDIMTPVMDNGIYAHALLDQFEGRIGGGQNAYRWEGQAWVGTDYDKLWLKSEGLGRRRGRSKRTALRSRPPRRQCHA